MICIGFQMNVLLVTLQRTRTVLPTQDNQYHKNVHHPIPMNQSNATSELSVSIHRMFKCLLERLNNIVRHKQIISNDYNQLIVEIKCSYFMQIFVFQMMSLIAAVIRNSMKVFETFAKMIHWDSVVSFVKMSTMLKAATTM